MSHTVRARRRTRRSRRRFSAIRSKFPWWGAAVALILVAEVAGLSLVAWSASSNPASGLVVPKGAASLSVSDQRDVVHTLRVNRVITPVDGWLIVQADWGDGIPDALLGSEWVGAGESRGLTIDLDSKLPLPKRVFVTLLADEGMPHQLEYFVPMRPGMEGMRGMGSTLPSGTPSSSMSDEPIVAGDQVVRAHVNVAAMSFAVGADQASLGDVTGTTDATSVVVPRVVAPAQSWVSVSFETTSGQIGDLLGARLVPAGESTGVVIPLKVPPGRKPVLVTLHVDLGTVGEFDFSPSGHGNNYDQPYVAGGHTVQVSVRLVR